MGMLLGTYLPRPVTRKYSDDEENDKMAYGSSSMQGWRETQEDAHNCILNYDPGASFFAVYDGHGGSEVSEYASRILPDFLKSSDYYKQGDYENALRDTFISFDSSLKTPFVVRVLKKLIEMTHHVTLKNPHRKRLMRNLRAGVMPLEAILAQYALAQKEYEKFTSTNDSAFPSISRETVGCNIVNSVDSQGSSSKLNTEGLSESEVSSSSSICGVKKKRSSGNRKNNENVTLIIQSNVSEGSAQTESNRALGSENSIDSPSCSNSAENRDVNMMCNGESVDVQSDEVVSSSVEICEGQDVGKYKSSGKGKSLVKHQPNKTESSKNLFGKFLFSDMNDDSSESESDDETFSDLDSKSDDDDDDDDYEEEEEEEEDEADEDVEEEEEEDDEGEGCAEEEGEERGDDEVVVKEEGDEVVAKEDDEVVVKEEDDEAVVKEEDNVENAVENNVENEVGDNFQIKVEEDEDEIQIIAEVNNGEGSVRVRRRFEEFDDELFETSEEDDDEEKENINKKMATPGCDSGCTALVALVKDNKLYVANAGDCRCVVSKNGEAIELSLDHKPENDIELRRIEKAGGRVHGGRVNDGLNLSRALGDHAYKQTPGLPPEEQMISPLPDVQICDLDPSVEFMILACDGIWNSMSSQEVVDFVRPKLQNRTEVVSKICEQLFDHCLAPDTFCDGTGCDNMTAIIVQFKNARLFSSKKRPVEENEAEEAPKKPKTEDVSSTDVIDSGQPSDSLLEKPSNSPDTSQ